MTIKQHVSAMLGVLLVAASAALFSGSSGGVQPAVDGGGASTAADVTVLDVAGLYLATDVEAALARLRQTYADFASLPATCSPEETARTLDTDGLYRCEVSGTSWAGPIWAASQHRSSHAAGGSDSLNAEELASDCLEGYGIITTGAETWACTALALAGPATTSGLTLATSRLLGRTTASTGAVEEITVSSPLTLSGGAIGVGTVGVANGGTGATTLAAHGPLIGNGTGAVTVGSPGSAGQVWTSNGASDDPTFQDAAGGGIGGGTGSNDDYIQCSDGTDGNTIQACNTASTLGGGTLLLDSPNGGVENLRLGNCEALSDWAVGFSSVPALCLTYTGSNSAYSGRYVGAGFGVSGGNLSSQATFPISIGYHGPSGSYAVSLSSDSLIAWDSGTPAWVNAADFYLFRPGSNRLGLRDAASSQMSFELYSLYTDASNYERITLTGTAGSKVTMKAETAGDGANDLDLELLAAGAGMVLVGGGINLSPSSVTPACTEGTSYYDASDHDFCDCVGAPPAWRSRGLAGSCTT